MPNCLFLSYSVQYNLHDTAEKQDKVVSRSPDLVVEAVGSKKLWSKRNLLRSAAVTSLKEEKKGTAGCDR
jgi:hypothetical protein